MILERSKTELADNKKLAIHRLLQSIHRLDYQCLNKPLKWKDESGEHIGYYHSMDLMHFLIKNLDIPSRSKLYQKLSLCKLAVPVLFQNEGQVYMDMSLRHVKTTWISEGHIVEGNVTNVPVFLFSMIRCGQISAKHVSKSMLANDLFNFKRDANLGSCGFFSRYSLSSNGSRKVSEGTVEGMWYEGTSTDERFQASFGLLNLRGDALQNIETAATVASISDVLFIFCGKYMFKNGVHKNLIQETNNKLNLNGGKEKKIKKLVVIFPEEEDSVVNENSAEFLDISETVVKKTISSKPLKLLASLRKVIQKALKKKSTDTIYTLSNRLKNENKESSTKNSESVENINNLLLKMMDSIKNADEDQRSVFRKQLFPLQSTRKDYAKTQREENRSTDMNERRGFQDELIVMRKSRFEMIKDGLPEIMSEFLKELLNDTTVPQKLMSVSNIQYALDDWCSKHLLDKWIQYKESTQLALLKDKEINRTGMHQVRDSKENNLKDTETKNCENLAKLLLDMSVGIESIFREVSEIHETAKTNDEYLIEEFAKGNRELPEVVATLLMKGVSVELMDGDGFTVPTEWLEEVLKSLEKCFQEDFKMTESPKIFVLTVLGAQSTGKSTLLNTMFGVQFPVSAGRCTKGAFMQLIPIFIDKFPYHGLVVIDTEGLGAPEYRQDVTHDNEIATFVLGISDLAIINVNGENPLNIENFLQISITALMRMTLVEFHPSIVFVHQNCDPTAKRKNTTGRYNFIQAMDDAVSAQAELFQTTHKFSCFQDIVDISLEDDKNDFIYFPQLFEGAPPMSPPSRKYSKSCSDLTEHILNKMKENFERIKNPQTLRSFAEKVKLVWKGVLEENFVLSLTNSTEIQVKYDVDNLQSKWKVEMESSMENVLEKLLREVEADFKAKQTTQDLLKKKIEELKTELNSTHDERKQRFMDHIKKQPLYKKRVYKDWEQKCINKMDQIRNQITEDCQRRLTDYYNYEKNDAKWKDELQKSKNKLQENARKLAKELLDRKEKDEKPEFTDKEIEIEFEKFWGSVKTNLSSKKETTFEVENVRANFVKEIGEKYGKTSGFKKIMEKFGFPLENTFNIEWVENSHVQIFRMKDSELLKDIENLIEIVQGKISKEVIGLCDAGGFKKMKFMYNYSFFNCGSSIKRYLAKAEAILIETHNQSSQKNAYNLTDAFKVMFSCFAAQIAIPFFEEAQQSFIDYMDVSTKLDNERENTKQLFTLLLKREGNLTIAASQIAKILHERIKDAAVKNVRIDCKDILLCLITQKIHVHGLVLHDVIAMLNEGINEETATYVKEYFFHPFRAFEKKNLHVFDACQDITLNNMIRVKFDTIIKRIKLSLKYDLQASYQKSLTDVICQSQSIRWLGIGEKDFDGIVMPKFNKNQAARLAKLSAYPPENERGVIESEVKKRMAEEDDIVKKLINLITETDEVSTDITLTEQDEVKKKVISDVNNHLFKCTKVCPLCYAPCNETHSEGVGPDSIHSSRCHRPQGFATYVEKVNKEFATLTCNDLINTKQTFSNPDTKYESVDYSNYRSVNSYYNSWNIEPVTGAESLYWKYITYHVTKNLERFFPKAKQADVKRWKGISKSAALKNINSLFHLDGNTIARNKDGFHIIKSLEGHWKVVLEKNFVLRLRNSTEIQVKYDVDNLQSKWKVEMESSMENVLEKLLREVEADFKAKQTTQDLLEIKKVELRTELHFTHGEWKQRFTDHIKKQPLHKKIIYKDWEQKCINEMDQIQNQIMEDCQRRLTDYYNYEKNDAKWKNELQKSKKKLQKDARKFAKKLLDRKEKDEKPEFTDKEIEIEFEKFWGSVKTNLSSKKETAFEADNVRANFVKEIGEKYGKTSGFKKIMEKFGFRLENTFNIEWVENSHVDFVAKDFCKIGKEIFRMKDSELLKDIENLTEIVQGKISKEVIGLCDAGGFKKMKFMYNYSFFNCGSSIKRYLAKAEAILIETHNQSSQKNAYNLTDAFKVMFSCFAAQIAIPFFEEAQQSFIDYMDVSTKLDNERENTKQLFTLLLKREGNLTIAASQIAKILHKRIKDAAVKNVRIDCKDILLLLITQKMHVHGLVLHDVIAMLNEGINEENATYVKEYFFHPFRAFEKKISHVFDACHDIKLNDMIRVKFDTNIRRIKQSLKFALQASYQKSLTEIMCQSQSIRCLGIGEKDFDGIIMPESNKNQAARLAKLSAYPPENERGVIESEVKKRMAEEDDIVKKLINLITETDEVSTDITLTEQDEVKKKVISDVNNHLFKCTKVCPLCYAPCNETHSEGVGPDSIHSSRCHRPLGFATDVVKVNKEFVTLTCNVLINTKQTFSNPDTKYESVDYSNYRSVNSYYNSWNIEPVTGAESLYWKYITCQLTKNLDGFFPKAKQADVKIWEGISKSDALKNINSLFHLDVNTIARNIDGFHTIKSSENHAN